MSTSVTYEEVEATTPKAVKLRLEDGRSLWIPRSVIEDGEDLDESKFGGGEIEVKSWFAEKEDL